MTDRVKGFIVTLDKDIRIDDVEPLMQAICMMKGVINVSPSISTHDDYMNRERIKHEIRMKIYDNIKNALE